MTKPIRALNGSSLSINASQIKVISFDLDDALYDNQPVIAKAEALSLAYLAEQFQLQNVDFSAQKFFEIRKKLLATDDIRNENLSLLRQVALAEFCQHLAHADRICHTAFEIFIEARSQVTITDEIAQLVKLLSQQFILVSATNGNCDMRRLSIAPYFTKNYAASDGYRAKPHPQMLQQALQDMSVVPQELLHIGDSVEKDGIAAAKAGVPFYHFAPFSDSQNLPDCCAALRQTLGL